MNKHNQETEKINKGLFTFPHIIWGSNWKLQLISPANLCHLFTDLLPFRRGNQWAFLLAWFNFNLSMDK